MTATVTLEPLDLAALIASRVCHDVISPVGAIVNGLEVLDGDDDSMRDIALDLIRKSARQASAKLKFCRLAFGASGSAGASIDTGDAETVARDFIEDDRTRLIWTGARQFMPKNRVKLLLNLLLVAQGSVPRGGTIDLTILGEGEGATFHIAANGPIAKVPQKVMNFVSGNPVDEEGKPIAVDAHGIQPFYAGLLARSCGLTVNAATNPDGVLITAR